MAKCVICGEEIKETDREALRFEISRINTGEANSGNICGDCVYSDDMKLFRLWRYEPC